MVDELVEQSLYLFSDLLPSLECMCNYNLYGKEIHSCDFQAPCLPCVTPFQDTKKHEGFQMTSHLQHLSTASLVLLRMSLTIGSLWNGTKMKVGPGEGKFIQRKDRMFQLQVESNPSHIFKLSIVLPIQTFFKHCDFKDIFTTWHKFCKASDNTYYLP